MAARVEVFRCVFPDGVVAAADMSAAHTQAEVDPLHSKLETFFATLGSPRLYVMNLIEVTASVFHS